MPLGTIHSWFEFIDTVIKVWNDSRCFIFKITTAIKERGGYFWQLEVRYSVTRSACLLEMWSWQNVRVLPLIKWSPKYYCTIKRSTQIRNGISLQQYQEKSQEHAIFKAKRERAKSKRHSSLRAPHQLILQRSAVANQIRETEHSKCCKKVDFSSKDLNDKIGAGIFVFSTWNVSRVMKISKFDFNLVSLWRKKNRPFTGPVQPKEERSVKRDVCGWQKIYRWWLNSV